MGLSQRISGESQKNSVATLQSESWRLNDVTHAIIFDDGEEFTQEVKATQRKLYSPFVS